MPMQSCYITGSYYVRNAVKHMYHNGLDETFLYHEKMYQIIWNIKSCRSFL